MDALTHLFLPLTVGYVLVPEAFTRRRHLGLAAFGVAPDFDKFLGTPGLLHSLVTIVPVCLLVLALERRALGSLRHSPVAVLFVLSHLLLDFLDGGPVPLLFPFVELGVGLHYPMQVSFGEGPLGVTIHGPPLSLDATSPRPGFNTYGFINSFGVASTLLFVIVYSGRRWRGRVE